MVFLITATTALNPNQEMTDFDYKKYSLENLENWLNDAISSAEATPKEIYDVIVSVVKESYYYHKDQASRANELLALLNGNGRGHIEAYDKLVCDKDDPSPECQGAWNDFWESSHQEYLKHYKDKVTKWQLPVEKYPGEDEYLVTFPDDLLEAANLKEGDTVQWIDRGDGSFEMRKV